MTRVVLGWVLCAAVGVGTAFGQIPTIISPAGIYTFNAPSPVTITHNDNSITFSWLPAPGPNPPQPPPPQPPVPPQPPQPPPPTPPQPPSPIVAQGLHVLIVYESSELSKYPAAQVNILYDQSLRSYLDSVTAVAGPKSWHEYRIWDKDVVALGDSQPWQDALKRPRTALPWIIIGNGTTGYEGPLPANVAATIELIKKYEVAK